MSSNNKMTIKQIAKDLSLCSLTVSSILNGNKSGRKIAQKTEKRVKDYVKKIGFHPSISALALRGKYSKNLGIVAIDSYRYPAHGLFINSIESYISCKKISSVMFSVNACDPAGLGEVVQQIKVYNVKKIIILATGLVRYTDICKSFLQNIKSNLPDIKCYLYDGEKLDDNNNFIFSAYRNPARRRKIVDKIAVKNSYEKIIVLGNPMSLNSSSPVIELEIIERPVRPIDCKPEYMVRDKFYMEYGRKLAQMVKSYDFKAKKTLVYIHNDFASMGFAGQMDEYGYKIPEDFGLISWSNLPATECMKITSLGFDHDKVAQDAIRWIDDDNPGAGQKEIKIVQNNAKSF